MTPEELAARLVELVGAGEPGVSGAGDRAVLDVPPDRWLAALRAARDELGCDFFDWLSAVDEGDDGFRIVAHVWSVRQRWTARSGCTRVPPGTSARRTRCSVSTSPAIRT